MLSVPHHDFLSSPMMKKKKKSCKKAIDALDSVEDELEDLGVAVATVSKKKKACHPVMARSWRAFVT